ncbi:MAG: hypothetical protein AAF221_12090 [Pseudomonadota bacterium]
MKHLLCLLAACTLAACAGYGNTPPERVQYSAATATVTLPSDRRGSIPASVYYPSGAKGPVPVVLFSTGAFSSPEKYDALLTAWAQAGYAVLAPLHVDSERWQGPRPAKQTEGLAWRRLDFLAVAGGEVAIEQAIGVDLDMTKVAASGHSFGALIAQVLGGAKPGPMAGSIGSVTPFAVSAIVAVSPPGPIPRYIEPAGWAQMTAPQLLTTGTLDIVPQMAPEWTAHLGGHRAHTGDSWGLVQTGVDHYFGNVIGRTEYPGPPQQAQFEQMVEISTDFLNEFLRGDASDTSRFQSAPTGMFYPDSGTGLMRR